MDIQIGNFHTEKNQKEQHSCLSVSNFSLFSLFFPVNLTQGMLPEDLRWSFTPKQVSGEVVSKIRSDWLDLNLMGECDWLLGAGLF